MDKIRDLLNLIEAVRFCSQCDDISPWEETEMGDEITALLDHYEGIRDELQAEITRLRALAELVPGLVDILDGLSGDHNFPDTKHGQTLAHAREVMEETK